MPGFLPSPTNLWLSDHPDEMVTSFLLHDPHMAARGTENPQEMCAAPGLRILILASQDPQELRSCPQVPVIVRVLILVVTTQDPQELGARP